MNFVTDKYCPLLLLSVKLWNGAKQSNISLDKAVHINVGKIYILTPVFGWDKKTSLLLSYSFFQLLIPHFPFLPLSPVSHSITAPEFPPSSPRGNNTISLRGKYICYTNVVSQFTVLYHSLTYSTSLILCLQLQPTLKANRVRPSICVSPWHQKL